MNSYDMRKTMNLVESMMMMMEASTNKNGDILDLIHDIFEIQKQPKLNINLLRTKIINLLDLLKSLDTSNNKDYHIKLDTVITTLTSIIRQLDPEDTKKLDFRNPEAIKILVMKMLRTIYNEIISNDASFEELATNNIEAKDKIIKLASMINDKSVDKEVKKASKLIYSQAKQIKG
jgi:hypothetical protein